MKIGYPCINRSLSCGTRTFRLASYSEERLVRAVEENLACLERILEFNVRNGIYLFRVSSDLVPFASHPVNTFDWPRYFRGRFKEIGAFIRRRRIRITMHPDQFTLLNSPDTGIFRRSARELEYHCRLLDLLGQGDDAKIQIHVGGVYGDKAAGLRRFARRHVSLDGRLRRRLVVENDHVSYRFEDCLELSKSCGIPVVFDTLHQQALAGTFDPAMVLEKVRGTWGTEDGIPLIDYSLQEPSGRRGAHAQSIVIPSFREFLSATRAFDFDIMLEIKDKERSAVRAVAAANGDPRFYRPCGSGG